ncbi:MAG: pseudouridine synthase [Vicinamibacterales bacterium]
MPERLQKILSAAGVASRRASERLILDGRVTVNGAVVTELGTRADSETDDIRVDGCRLQKPRRRYLLLNKPRGYITSRSDPEGRPTVLDLLPSNRGYLYPVGRLDYDSEGLLILTNDGDLAQRLMHPSHEIEREYEVTVVGWPDGSALRRLRQGIALEGRRTKPATVRLEETRAGRDQAKLTVVLREGRSRQIRKMCEAVGHPVVRLRRVRIGPIRDASLAPGSARDLTAREVALLKKGNQRSGKSSQPVAGRNQPPERRS